MKKPLVLCLTVIFVLSAALTAPAAEVKIKNVILLIPDGMSPQAATLARLYKGKKLNIDDYSCGMVRTYQAEGPITDSASAATAMATGFKTNSGYISCLPEKGGMPGVTITGAKKAPVATILEAAKLAGKATGIVSTVYVQHATPAAFAGHYPDRNQMEILAEQMVYISPDVVLGGGNAFLANRKDKEDLIPVIEKAGYDYVVWPGRMRSSSSAKLWGMFAPKDLKHELDRNKDAEPSLAEMTEKALEVLSKDADGFFLMVEGGKIDWAAHANDPAGLVSDILSFDAAAGIAFDFAEKNRETIVIAAADHGTGGLSIGDQELENYSEVPIETIIAPLKRAKTTGEGLFKKLFKDKTNMKQAFLDEYGVSELSHWEQACIETAGQDNFNHTAGPMLSRRCHIGWASNGHTGDDVVLYCFDPRGNGLSGVIQNTRIASYMEEALGLDLKAASEELFVPVSKLKEDIIAAPSYADPENPVLVLKKGGASVSFPANKNIAITSGKKHAFTGITVYNGKDWFLPKQAFKLADELLK